jgi:4'-phosphopantetheinyl transferase EntD
LSSNRHKNSSAWPQARRQIPPFAAFALRTAPDGDTAIHEAEAALLHPRAVPARRLTFRLGRLAAHAALQEIGMDTGPILAGDHREPQWPPGVVGSISHTVDTGVALVAPEERTDGIGIDIELQRNAPELETQVPRAEERLWLDKLAAAEREAQLMALFSAKEAVFKAFFPSVGSFFGFAAASLLPTSSGFRGRLVAPIDDRYPPLRTFAIGCEWSGNSVLTWLVLPKTD